MQRKRPSYKPPWKSIGLEFAAAVFAYLAIVLFTGNATIALLVALAAMFMLRLMRPKIR